MEVFKNINAVVEFLPDKMKKNGVFETERLFCDVYCFEPGQEQSPHVHQGSDKIYLVVDGKGIFQVGDAERELAKDEIAIAPAGQKHGVRNPGPLRLVLVVFMAPKPAH